MHTTRYTLLVGLGLLLAACGSSPSGTPTAQTQKAQTSGTSAISAQGLGAAKYLVGFKGGVSDQAVTKAGGQLTRSFGKLGAAAVTLTPSALAALQNDPSVEYVELDLKRTIQIMPGVTDASAGSANPAAPTVSGGRPNLNPGTGTTTLWTPSGEYTYGTVALGSPALHTSGTTGTGIAVCVADTGIDAGHPEFVGRIREARNFVDDGHLTADDGNEHGTHVSGTIAAQLGNGSAGLLSGMVPGGVVGVAPGVSLYVARVLGDDGTGSSSGVVDGVNWCVSQLKSQGGREDHVIISLSLGSDEGSKTEQRAFAKAFEAGALIVAASGNSGDSTLNYPASYPTVLSVGATDDKNNLASFSTFNKKVELVAPGVDVISSVPRGSGTGAAFSAAGLRPSTALPASPRTLGDVSAVLAAAGGDRQLCAPDANLAGKIALISRGTCSFAVKVNNAVASGALAAVVYNNRPGSISMDLGTAKAIPAISLTQVDGQAALAAINGSLTGRVRVYASDYAALSGTSMATPHVSAAAALVWSKKPSLSNDGLRSLLDSTATDLGANGRDLYFGHGLVNPGKAITGR